MPTQRGIGTIWAPLSHKVNCAAREGALGYKVNCAAREGALGYRTNHEGHKGQTVMLSRLAACQGQFVVTTILLYARRGEKQRPVLEQQGVSECLNG